MVKNKGIWGKGKNEEWLILKMGLAIKENGLRTKKLDRGKAYKYGQMDLCMKDGGKIIKQMEKVDLFTLMVISMMVIGKTIKPMGLECTHI
jgi:hypothetical protein